MNIMIDESAEELFLKEILSNSTTSRKILVMAEDTKREFEKYIWKNRSGRIWIADRRNNFGKK